MRSFPRRSPWILGVALAGCGAPGMPSAGVGRCVPTVGEACGFVEGAYQVRWQRGGAVAGVLTLARGTYDWAGVAPPPGGRTFGFVQRPHGRYEVILGPVPVVDLSPDDSSGPASERLVEVRQDPSRGVRYFHSVVSELETWQIETQP